MPPRSVLDLFAPPPGGPPPGGGQPGTPPGPRVMQVSELCRDAKHLLESRYPRVQVRGEISNLIKHRSGHWYFNLKDSQANLKAVMFAGDNRAVRFALRDGLEVVATGRVSLYEPQGSFQLVVSALVPSGAGELAAAYEALKAKLEKEGLFAAARKRPLPFLPVTVGVVTSLDGAAIRDILQVLGRRAPQVHVVVSPARVQGPGAAAEIVEALQRLDASGRVEVIILGRGGGSLEDLWAFNEELLARAIAACRTPVVSAVGHETDTTISDWVADVRAPTPSAAAELVAPDRRDLLQRLDSLEQRLGRAALGRVQGAQFRLEKLRRRLPSPSLRLRDESQHLDDAEARAHQVVQQLLRARQERLNSLAARLAQAHPSQLLRAQRERFLKSSSALTVSVQAALEARAQRLRNVERRLWAQAPVARVHGTQAALAERLARAQAAVMALLARDRQRLTRAVASLEALSPLSVLTRGYALVRRAEDGAVVRSPADAPAGTELDVRVAQGELRVRSQGPKER